MLGQIEEPTSKNIETPVGTSTKATVEMVFDTCIASNTISNTNDIEGHGTKCIVPGATSNVEGYQVAT
jgi:hypothetical protein